MGCILGFWDFYMRGLSGLKWVMWPKPQVGAYGPNLAKWVQIYILGCYRHCLTPYLYLYLDQVHTVCMVLLCKSRYAIHPGVGLPGLGPTSLQNLGPIKSSYPLILAPQV